MTRIVAIGRKLAVGRKPTKLRKLIPVPPRDEKKRVVLDTGIFVAALISKKRGFSNSAPYRILEALKNSEFYLVMNANLFSEHNRVLNHQAQLGRIDGSEIGSLLKLVREKGFFGRMFVDKPVNTYLGGDDLLFDGSEMIGGDFLVTMDMGDLRKYKKDIRIGNLKIVGPRDFMRKLKS